MLSDIFQQHLRAACHSLGALWRRPLTSLLVIVMIGIALALPMGLYVLTQNLQRLTGGLSGQAPISLFLQLEVKPTAAQSLAKRLREQKNIKKVVYISAEDGLAQFTRSNGFSEALPLLHDNPLPAVLEVYPENASGPAMEELSQRLTGYAEVAQVQVDTQWVARLRHFLILSQRGVLLLGILLMSAVLLTIINSIRAVTWDRATEMRIIQLVGGTSAFIRRPFLYTGLYYGLLGATLAYLIIQVTLHGLQGPVAHLAQLYNSTFQLMGMDKETLGELLGGACLLGIAGAWVAVGQQLRRQS